MHLPLPLTRDLVLVGGGHTHALALRSWAMNPLAGVRVTLIDSQPLATYSGMLPGFVAGHYPRSALDIDLVRLCRFAGARFVAGQVTGFDPTAQKIEVADRPPIEYDVAALNIGVTARMPDLEGFSEYGVAVRPLAEFAARWSDYLSAVEGGTVRPAIALLGAGLGGVELALAMAHRLPGATITLLEAETPLASIRKGARARLLALVEDRGIALHTGARALKVDAGGVHMSDGAYIDATFVVGSAGARPRRWLAETGLPLEKGFIEVDETLAVPGCRGVFAAGDCAHLMHRPRPKAGVFAVRQAPVLLRNLRAALGAGKPEAYRPQADYLKLVSLGPKSALAEKKGIRAEGRWLWVLKDRIDRKFIDRLNNLPPMRRPGLPTERAAGVEAVVGDGQPVCGGCGAKVGQSALNEALSGLPQLRRDDIVPLPGDDAAELRIDGVRQVITTDHLRAFTDDPWLLARVAALHALGDIWAMGAKPQAALANVTLPPMTDRLQTRTLKEIMHAATTAFSDAGAGLVGGHTTQGAELSIGFTVTGLADGPVKTLAGAQAGDRLILTKPIGSGVILAAEMALEADAQVARAAHVLMCQSQAVAAELLAGSNAITDVTGFGLAGHLLNICRASGVGAEIALDRIPLMDGAERLAADGIRSVLLASNRADCMAAVVGLPDTAAAELLFDPQTGGGLLAAVPSDQAAVVDRLRDAGYQAAQIGRFVEGPPGIVVL